MRFNTPINSSPSASLLQQKDSPSSVTTYTLSYENVKGAPIKVKPSAHDMKDTSTVHIANPKFRKHNVAATDNFVAPVAKIQQWLADDPTKPKKEFLTVRKGNNIIAKSNIFEKQTMAFGTKNGVLKEVAEKTIVTNNRKHFEGEASPKGSPKTAKTKKFVQVEPKVEEPKVEEPKVEEPKAEEPKEESMVDEPTAEEPKDEELDPIIEIGETKDDAKVVAVIEALSVVKVEEEKEEITDTIETEKVDPPEVKDDKIVIEAKVVDMDLAKINFEEKKSFNDAKAEFVKKTPALNSVQLLKEKVEEAERENRRRANNPYGLMKSRWRRPHPSRGLPSNAWKRTFQGQIPPKKTIAELP